MDLIIEQYLRNNYLHKDSIILAKELNLHKTTICYMLKKLGLNRKIM